MLKNLIFITCAVAIAWLWKGFANFDIFLPTIAFMYFRNQQGFGQNTVTAAIAYSFIGSYLWFQNLSTALLATTFIAIGFISAGLISSLLDNRRPLKSLGLAILMVVAYDNIASIPMFYSAFIANGLSGLYSQIILGIPFTLKHLASFFLLFTGWEAIYQLTTSKSFSLESIRAFNKK